MRSCQVRTKARPNASGSTPSVVPISRTVIARPRSPLAMSVLNRSNKMARVTFALYDTGSGWRSVAGSRRFPGAGSVADRGVAGRIAVFPGGRVGGGSRRSSGGVGGGIAEMGCRYVGPNGSVGDGT
jgi:hypothetical protein